MDSQEALQYISDNETKVYSAISNGTIPYEFVRFRIYFYGQTPCDARIILKNERGIEIEMTLSDLLHKYRLV